MEFKRASGVLLHPTSFPGPYGIGDLGAEAYRFVDFLHDTRQQLWQVLPLNPTGFGDSPYASFSAFAGNPLLISPDILLGQGLLEPGDLQGTPDFSEEWVEFGPVIEWKMALLGRAYRSFKGLEEPEIAAMVRDFEAQNVSWLEDYALFMAAKAAHQGAVWNQWEEGLARRDPQTLAEWRSKLAEQIEFHKFIQYIFFQQWSSLKEYANERDVRIMGDIPIFVAYDSADVWGNPDLFYLDEKGNSTVVAGVPPDYFSVTGQRWGNPLYNWARLAESGYEWWIERFRTTFTLVDVVRIDHFRGFEAYWEVPAAEDTAVNGRWVQGPGLGVFRAVFEALGERAIIVEDLGLITEGVNALRKELGFPGMRVLQFAFGDTARNVYLPHNYEANTLVYTGTHDNDTTTGWWLSAPPHIREHVRRYLGEATGEDAQEITWKIVRLAWSSVADLAIAPLQDLLSLGNEARMNAPGHVGRNWGWRYHPGSLSDWLRERLLDLTLTYGRYLPPEAEAEAAAPASPPE